MKQNDFFTVINSSGDFAVEFGYYTVGACGYLQAAVCDFKKKEKLISEQRANPFSKSFGEKKSETCAFSLKKEGSEFRFLCDNKITFFHTACKADVTVAASKNGALKANGYIEIQGRRFEVDDTCTVLRGDYPAEFDGLTVSGSFGEAPFVLSCDNCKAELSLNGKRYILPAFFETTGAKGYGNRIFTSRDGSVMLTVMPLFNDRLEKSAPLSSVHQNRFLCRAEGFVDFPGGKLEFENEFAVLNEGCKR